MKNFIAFLLLATMLWVTSSCGGIEKPEKREDGDKLVNCIGGKQMTADECEAYIASKKNGKGRTKIGEETLDSVKPLGKPNQFHELPNADSPGTKPDYNLKPAKITNTKREIVYPDISEEGNSIKRTPYLKTPEIVVDEALLASANPVLAKAYKQLVIQHNITQRKLETVEQKLDRVITQLPNSYIIKPYTPHRVQQLTEILDMIRERRVQQLGIPHDMIDVRILEFLSVEGMRDDVLREFEKEIIYLNELIAGSIRFDLMKAFDKNGKPRKVIRLNWDVLRNGLHKARRSEK